MLFTSKGKMYKLLVDNIPVGTNVSKGTKIGTIINMEPNEKVIAMTSLYRNNSAKYVVFFTKKGLIKKTKFEEYDKIKKSAGIAAINLKDGDTIANVAFLNEENVIIITKKGMAIHFITRNINPIGRVTAGVRSIKLSDDDEVLVGLPVYKLTDYIAFVTSNGYVKKCKIDDFPTQMRAGKGIIAYRPTLTTGEIVGAVMINDTDNFLMIGQPNSICIGCKEIPLLSRISSGSIAIKNSKVMSVVKL